MFAFAVVFRNRQSERVGDWTMSWLVDFVAPKIKAFIGGSTSEDNLWTKCPICEKLIYNNELESNLMVCVHCSHHFKIKSKERFNSLFDDQKYDLIDLVKVKDDPIKFRDAKRYVDKLKEARQKSGLRDAIEIAKGKINGAKAVVFSMDFSFMGGSMGLAVGKSFTKAVRTAISTESALIGFASSGGARMQEGTLSLMQLPATVASLCELKDSGLPYISVMTNPTTGGVLASFATLGDIHIAEPKSLIGFAGARVIEKTMKQKLPAGFQTAEFLLAHGMLDMIVHRKDMRNTIGNILDYVSKN
jgi:acetyl-CoA carboxylase carboxyl transferase subunit beta